MDFSFDGRNYRKGEAVKVTDEIALETLKERKHITEGEGTESKSQLAFGEQPGETKLSEKVNPERYNNDMPEKSAKGPVPESEAKRTADRNAANQQLAEDGKSPAGADLAAEPITANTKAATKGATKTASTKKASKK